MRIEKYDLSAYLSILNFPPRQTVLVTLERHNWYGPPLIFSRDDTTGLWQPRLAFPTKAEAASLGASKTPMAGEKTGAEAGGERKEGAALSQRIKSVSEAGSSLEGGPKGEQLLGGGPKASPNKRRRLEESGGVEVAGKGKKETEENGKAEMDIDGSGRMEMERNGKAEMEAGGNGKFGMEVGPEAGSEIQEKEGGGKAGEGDPRNDRKEVDGAGGPEVTAHAVEQILESSFVMMDVHIPPMVSFLLDSDMDCFTFRCL
jgi:hypothetical protein